MTKEQREQLLQTQSPEEAAALVRAAGKELTAEDTAHLWEEVVKHREQAGQELSMDELDAVSGGSVSDWEWGDDNIDWLVEGCYATVEAGSWCWSSDRCYSIEVQYIHTPSKIICSECGGEMTHIGGTVTRKYQCRKGHISFRGF